MTKISFPAFVREKHKDAVIWKANELWATATDPDLQAAVIDELTETLAAINNEAKRTGYVELLQKDLKIKSQVLKKSVNTELQRRKADQEAKNAKAKLEAVYQNNEDAGLPTDFKGNIHDALKYGIYEHEGVYYTRGSRGGGDFPISNFTMKILYHIQTGDDHAYRMISIENVYGFYKMIMMNTDDFVSIGSFKKVIARQGDFIFKGADSDLSRLQEFLQKDEKRTIFIKSLGWNKRGSFYAFANGVVVPNEGEVKFVDVDKYGILTLNDKNYVIPALSEMYIDKDEMYTNEKKFVFKKAPMDFNEWASLFIKAYGEKGKVAILFYIGCLFRDIIMKQIQRYPLLNLFGPPGAGKGQIAESLMAMFGEPQDQIMLGGASTVVGFMRKFAQFSNALVWLDEYKNNLPVKFIESFKNLYDGKGYERGKMTNDFSTESTPILSSCILSGQDMPTQEAALFMRCIMLTFREGKFTQEQRDAFQKLKDVEKNGLSEITASLLHYRGRVEDNFKEKQSKIFQALFKEIANPNVDDRMILNISILLTLMDIFQSALQFPFTYDQVKKFMIENMMAQHSILAGNNDVAKFWEIVQGLYFKDEIKEGREFIVKDSHLYIRLQQVHPAYQKHCIQIQDKNHLSKTTLEHYFSIDSNVFIDVKKQRFPDGTNTSSFVFNYEKLCERYGIDFSRRKSPMDAGFSNQEEQPGLDFESSGWKPVEGGDVF